MCIVWNARKMAISTLYVVPKIISGLHMTFLGMGI